MLHEFLNANRAELVRRCELKGVTRHGRTTSRQMEYGVPLFLGQLIETLRSEGNPDLLDSHAAAGRLLPKSGIVPTAINSAATKHGSELLRDGYRIDEVVHDYGDLCQAVTELAFEENVMVSVGEFHTFNRCLDDAIAGAVAEFSGASDEPVSKLEETVGDGPRFPAQEMRTLLNTASLAFAAMKSGSVSLQGATSAALDGSLVRLRELVDRSLGELHADRPPLPGSLARPLAS